jgi:hypothetical protein
LTGKSCRYGLAEVPARRTRIAKQRRRKHSARRRRRWWSGAIVTKAPEVIVVPFHSDPRALVFVELLSFLAFAVGPGWAVYRLVGRLFEESDPRRQLIAQVLLYVGAFVAIAVTIWETHRG